MAAQPQPPSQPVYHHELNLALDNLYAKLTRYMDARFDTISIQTRADINNVKQELKTEIGQLNQQMTNVEGVQADILKTQADIVKTLSDVVTHQQTLMTTFNTTTQAIVKTMQDNHAEAMEAINDVKVRVTRLEERDK